MPHLLFISPRFLFPMDQGGKIRTGNILKALKGGAFEIVLASPVPNNVHDYQNDIETVSDEFLSWPAPSGSKIRRLAALFDTAPIGAATDRSRTGSAVVAAALAGRPDVIVVDFPHAAVLLPQGRNWTESASVMFTHNVEAEIFERHADVATGIWRAVWRDQSRKMRRFEDETLNRFDSVIAVSERDAMVLRKNYDLSHVDAIDTGVDLDFYRFAEAGDAPSFDKTGGSIVFTGAMAARANIDGIAFLMDEIWPLVIRDRPNARAVIVGRNPPAELVARAKSRNLNWHFTGFVEDIRPHVAANHVSVIPLRVGSGTRIKAFEAMSMGRPVVSTTVGVEGLDIAPGEHYLNADTAGDFAAAILRLLGDDALRESMARAARKRVEDRFSWAQVARQFEAICHDALSRKGAIP